MGEALWSKIEGRLGLQKRNEFNLALFGKHVWHFLSKPDSLVARLFKERYYPSGHVLQTKGHQDDSFIWKGIREARDALYYGFRWVLGDGLCINIFDDRWLKGKYDFKVENIQGYNNRNDKVHEYFHPDIKQWDVNKIRQTFHDIDANCILKLRIPQKCQR